MLNIKGAFVITGTHTPYAILIGPILYNIFMERQRIVDYDKAIKATFGNDAEHALPCNTECMEFIALQYVGAYQEELRSLCACIVLRKPISNWHDYGEGGQRSAIDPVKPLPTMPGGDALDYLAQMKTILNKVE
jgi:hypothetical protein